MKPTIDILSDMDTPFDTSLLAELLAASKEEIASPSPDAEVLLNILLEIEKELSITLQKCREEISCITGDANNGTLRQSYASSLAGALLRIENLLYAYSDNAFFDPYVLWQYINKNRNNDQTQVTISVTEKAVLVYLPSFPKKGRGNDALVNQMLAARIYSTPEFPSWPKWEAQFYHVYPTNAKTIPRDVDNYDYKKTIDLIAFALGSADNALNFSMKMDTVFTNDTTAGVYIRVIPKSCEKPDFQQWSVSP